jgi:hypothetical protein
MASMQSITFDGNKVISYSTHVADIKGNDLVIYGKYSPTTSKHLKQLAAHRGLDIVQLQQSDRPAKTEQETASDNPFKAVAFVAAIGDVMEDTIEGRNAWKKRMVLAGVAGISFPEDWDSLDEKVKEKRLDSIIKVMNE